MDQDKEDIQYHTSQIVKRETVVHSTNHKGWQAHRKRNPVPRGLWFYTQSNNLQRPLQSKSRWKTTLQYSGANKNSAAELIRRPLVTVQCTSRDCHLSFQTAKGLKTGPPPFCRKATSKVQKKLPQMVLGPEGLIYEER